MHLPRTYLARGGVDVRGISEGMDLNQFVFEHYMELKEGKADGVKAVNYVHADDVVSRRHEYLGPDPRIAGYFFDNYGEVHIRWWDGFLKDQWMDQQKWKLSVKVDGSGQWVVKED
ncbi:hypothetical protein SERLA73DRAFT_129538 [Serpula lacrymans var. lacrymans S7.3]|uniref:Uncharacterized protein n=2 Tax=Serpula lacrymans var. lacrymans TaxID=341189 RepID=F8PK27_SERL3|nr:uncharacterized protein SERLADRAFT_377408 [Serpula lacrymans var. lacrymans S7.9]EGO03267.1 hypothetical protein SERLA73DRAFT_129538 [Serpula lacrymans var. lacrymans S7.3]EGO29049.1 hypothetical protein SERLADRAFT_377408 [Serpula lacrymans var. lacrymans S7.9]